MKLTHNNQCEIWQTFSGNTFAAKCSRELISNDKSDIEDNT